MGFEVFRVELRGGSLKFDEANAVIQNLPQIKPDPDSMWLPGSSFYLYEDGRHIIEFELKDSSPLRLSCRFTMCHPSSVDEVFLSFVLKLMECLDMEVDILEGIPPFRVEDSVQFRETTLGHIATQRAGWIQMFGRNPMALNSREQFERVILPMCEPVAERTTTVGRS